MSTRKQNMSNTTAVVHSILSWYTWNVFFELAHKLLWVDRVHMYCSAQAQTRIPMLVDLRLLLNFFGSLAINWYERRGMSIVSQAGFYNDRAVEAPHEGLIITFILIRKEQCTLSSPLTYRVKPNDTVPISYLTFTLYTRSQWIITAPMSTYLT